MYSDGEVCKAYRLAKKKEEQVEICAQLNDCSKNEIRGILIEADMYAFTAEVMKEASLLIIEKGLSFGNLRNYIKAFQEMGADDARMLFKEFSAKPWDIRIPDARQCVTEALMTRRTQGMARQRSVTITSFLQQVQSTCKKNKCATCPLDGKCDWIGSNGSATVERVDEILRILATGKGR